jgi:hypothetical protein
VDAAVELNDGAIVIAGSFNLVNGVRRAGAARINPDGSLDARFDPGILLTEADSQGRLGPATILGLLPLPDNDIIVSAGMGWAGRLLRIQPDGSLSPRFKLGQIRAEVDGDGISQSGARPIEALALNGTGGLFIGGEISQVNGQPRQGIALLRTETEGRQSLGFESADNVGGEGTGQARVYLARVGDLTRSARVRYSTQPGTAADGQDFTAGDGVVEFAPFESRQSFTVTLKDDGEYEPDETILLTLYFTIGGAPVRHPGAPPDRAPVTNNSLQGNNNAKPSAAFECPRGLGVGLKATPSPTSSAR